MTWLAPWALIAGAVGMLGVIAAHLLARQRPRAVQLATARFLPAGMLEATTVQRTPRDRWWMALRLLILALLGLGLAQPVVSPSRVPVRTVLLLDRSLPVDVRRQATADLTPDDAVLAFDSATTLVAATTAQLVPARVSRRASLSAAFARLIRARDSLAAGATALHVVVASTFAPAILDPATASLRAAIPDSIATRELALAPDSVVRRAPATVHAEPNDPIAATAMLLADSVAPAGAVLQRGGTLTGADSVAATSGATVVWWPAADVSGSTRLEAMTVHRTTWIAPLQRITDATPSSGMPIAWWADGAPAAWLSTLGNGCIVRIAAKVPRTGDHALSLGAQAALAALLTSCDPAPRRAFAPPTWLRAAPNSRVARAPEPQRASIIAPWLVGAALALALAELLLRGVRRT
jgi:Aerotolerance regulator N-terminal